MNHNLEWIEQTLSHEESDAVPYQFSFSPPARTRTEQYYGPDFEQTLDFPIRMTGLNSIKPLYPDPDDFGDTVQDEFGVTWSTNKIDRGAPIGPCLTEPTLSGYSFPDSEQPFRFKDIGSWCFKNKGNYRIIWVGDLWERATFMRGMTDLLLDVALNTRFVEALLRGIADCVLRSMEILFDRFEFEGVAISDDYGTQKATIISPEDWRKLVKPCLSGIYALAKKNGRTVFHHSCGHIVPIIGDMIDIGLDILHPIQPEAMDILFLKKEFGSRLTLCGGVSTQDLLVNATPDQVRQEVRHLKRQMGKAGGYILEPGITLQNDVPLENIIAMINEARSQDQT
ncbi:uroporphyrinogen decarboxylase family protein [Verrucomicrobiota bacterium]